MLIADHGGATTGNDLRNWVPRRISWDDALLKEKDILDARTISAARDWPMLMRAIRRKRDEIIGGGDTYRMDCRPVWRALPEPFDEEYAYEWGGMVSRTFKALCDSSDCWLDAQGQKTHTQILEQAYMTWRQTGDVVGVYSWDDKNGPFATRLLLCDPGRVRDPDDKPKDELLRGGFALSRQGYAYKCYLHDHLKSHRIHPNERNKYQTLLRKIDGGQRTQWVHIFDDEFPGATRGRNAFTPALTFINMLSSFERNVLRSAAIQARHAAFIQSKYPERDREMYTPQEKTLEYLKMIDTFYHESPLKVDGSVIPHLMPDTEYKESKPSQPINNYPEFTGAMNLHLAAGADMGYGEYTGDTAQASYSTLRQEETKARTTNEAIQANIVNRLADHNGINVVEELVSKGIIPIKGMRTSRQRLSFFRRYKHFLCNFVWFGAREKHIDPVKSAVSENILMKEVGSRLMRDHLGTQYNLPMEEWIDAKKRETNQLRDAGLEHLITSDVRSPAPGQGQIRADSYIPHLLAE